MSTFTLNSITVQGLNVIAKLVAGSRLEFTRIAIGDGAMPSDKTPLTVTDLTHKLFDVDINSVVNNNNGSATVMGVFSNTASETGFFYRELGLFAKDPDTQKEFLYCYGNAAADAEWISPAGSSSVIEKEVKIITLIGNAEKVTANIKSGIYATKEEVNATMILKADLDNTAEEGGRVLASQMRFDADQTIYVDAAAAEGGDGSQLKPFKTIQAAINARYKGAPVIYIRIKAGTYKENISVPRTPGTTWRFIREGAGTVAINTAVVDNCTYILFDNLTFNGPATDNSTIIYVANTASANLNAVTVNGANNATGINFSTSRGIIRNSIFNNCGLAIAATDGAYLDLKVNSGTGNTRALQSDGSIIISDWYIPEATTKYEKVNGGVISIQGGDSSFPSNYSQLYNLGDFTDAEVLRTAIMTEFNKLDIGEVRNCWFANNIVGGFGIFDTGQRMQAQIIKSTNSSKGYGTIIFNSHHNAPAAFMQIQDGSFTTATPVKFITQNDIATMDTYGLVRVADDTDVLNDDNDEAAITPAVYHDVSDFRHKETAYELGDKVECMFNFELFLECTQAGTTSSESLNTRNVTHGQELTDGTVKWTVRTHIKSVNNIVADVNGNIDITKNTMDIKVLTEPLDDWCNLQTGIYAVDTANFFSSATLNKPNVPQGGICMVYNAGEYAQIEFFPDNYNSNPSAPKCVKRKVRGEWSNWFTETAPMFLFASPAMTGKPTAPTATPDTKTTQVATTEFAHSILQRAVGKTEPTLTALIDWDAMATANGGQDVRNIKNNTSGITAYGGDQSLLNNGDIILKTDFTNYDALLINFTTDRGDFNAIEFIPMWEFNIMFNTKGYLGIIKSQESYWEIMGNANQRPSTNTRFNIHNQNCGIIEIYGVTY